MNDQSRSGRQTPKEYALSLRARGLEPIANYVIIPVAGSLVGDIPSLRDNPERANAVVEHMIATYGARRARPQK